jgi:protein O-GlcNAc transferase
VFLDRAVELAPFILDFKVKLGTAYFMSGQYESAERAYKSALSENPKLEEALSNLGYVQIILEDFDSAEENLEKSLALNPDYKEAKLNLATLYMSTDRMEDAMNLLLKLLETYPGDAKVRAAIQYIENSYG